MHEHTFEYPSVLESEDRMLDDLAAVLHSHRVADHEAQAFMVVVSEAFTNALVHGNQQNANKIIRVDLRVNETTVAADITDQGSGGLERVKAHQPPGLMAENGRGLHLIRHYATECAFRESESGGLIVSVHLGRGKLKREVKCS